MTTETAVKVIGVGNPARGDDGVGPAVARTLSLLRPDGVEISHVYGDAAGIMAAWEGVETAILVDACVAGDEPGHVRRIDVSQEPLPPEPSATSTHAFGLAAAVRLAEALGSRPANVILYAVEAKSLDHGAMLTPEIAHAVPQVVSLVKREIEAIAR